MPKTLLEESKAWALAARLNQDEKEQGTDWSYEVFFTPTGFAYVAIFDETGALLGTL